MKNNNSLKNNNQLLSKVEKKVFDKACSVLMKVGWDPIIEHDPDWGWVILACRKFTEFGTVLRRIKPFRLNSLNDFQKALKLQSRIRKDLVEVIPFKLFLGNKIHVSTLDNSMDFLSKANASEWTKFFKSKKDMVNY